MTSAEWHSTLFQFIGTILTLATFIGSIVAIYFTYQNLKEMKKQLTEQRIQYFEQNRGNLIFYIEKNQVDFLHSLIIKNFGNSPAKLLSLKITPSLDWGKAGQTDIDEFNIANIQNVFLAPQQHISSIFDFRNYPDKKFEIEICYQTCKKNISEKYSIDIDFLDRVLTTRSEIKDELSALKKISASLESLSNKLI
ncbi:hypothetical protein GCM10008910_13770 [Faecalicatena orotica]|uniref:Uncharacterized protein n=1 Tax=Faecalicatena orotica TaxID=1544 RepID=A0A2Y9C9Q1_9FIRM|nr:hypothetical protein [Faecalicatena orotica]PWJ31421.1 hypothetical protein A8806_102277 [Faecalicatena orotica]SSA54627.1 hypothetical protein SAMN05216536_102277 [Faecalicatena orotica]